MRYVEYGRTGKQVSVVGFGGMRFDLSRSQEENADLVRHACAQGINYFDTAPGYCQDQSEAIFGEAFKDMPGDFYVSTKGMPVNYDTAEKAREAVMRSIERMGVEKINFYHVWCLRKMEHYELAMKSGGQYEGLMRCKEEGLIDHIVCSSHQPGNEITKILEKDEFEGILLGANILNFPYRWDGVLTANQRGCGVVAMNPLAGGSIPQHEKEFAFLASEGETPTEAALRFVIAAPQITVALNGFTTKEHVDMACKVADKAAPMTEAEIERIRGQLGANMNEVCTACGYCKDCPQNIPIPGYMQVYNDKVMFSRNDEAMVKEMNHHLNWGILVMRAAGAAECIECGKCEEACTQHLPIMARLKDMAGWEEQL